MGTREDVRRYSAHDAGVFHFFALLARAAAEEHQLEEYRLVWWEVGALAERRYLYQGNWHNLRPDGAGLFQAGKTHFRFWLEWDQGSMNLADLVRKFVAYDSYLASGEWQEAPDRIIPHLLVIVPSLGQLRRMRRAASMVAARHPLLIGRTFGDGGAHLSGSITLASRFEEVGPLAPIWWPLLSEPSELEHATDEPLGSINTLGPAHSVL